MARFVLTGGGGYIGTRLAARLIERGDHVVLILRDAGRMPAIPGAAPGQVDRVMYDGTGGSLAAAFADPVDGVFHLASMAVYQHDMDDIAPMIAANITLGTQLLESMALAGCRAMVNVGTYWQNYAGPVYDPICLYAATKQAMMDIVSYYTHWRDIGCVTVKLTDVYGPQDPRGKVFALLERAIETGEPLPMTSGEQRVSFLHVDDAVGALLAAYERVKTRPAQHEVFTVGTAPVTLREAVAVYLETHRQKVDILWGALAQRPTQIMDPNLDAPLPGWRPQLSLQDGLRSLRPCRAN